MKTIKRIILLALFAALTLQGAAQEESINDYSNWTLTKCLDYALEHNINVLQKIVAEKQAYEDLEKAKQAFAPNLSANTGQNYNYDNLLGPNGENIYSASYGVNLSMPLFMGGKLLYSKKQNQIILESSTRSVDASKIQIKTSVLKAYLQVLYDNETVKSNEKIFELSSAEYERSKAMYEVGKITKSALAQVASQWASNKYNLTISRNTLRLDILALKQELELDITVDFSVNFPEIDDTEILAPLPNMLDIYYTAMDVLPGIKVAELNIQSAEVAKRVAQSGWIPTISLKSGMSGAYSTAHGMNLEDQFRDDLGFSAGITINVPIYDQRTTLTAVNKAKFDIENKKLAYQQADKEVSKNVETLYVDAQNAQDNYITAKEKLGYAQESYDLVAAQYNVGMKNTVDLLTEEKNLYTAEQEVIQCRYKAIISIQLLNVMQDKEIKVGENN